MIFGEIFNMNEAKKQAINFAHILDGGGGRHTQVDHGIDFSITLVQELRDRGWKNAKSYTYNSKAIYEAYLKKNGCYVNIVTTNFLGVFTQIDLSGTPEALKRKSSIRFIED